VLVHEFEVIGNEGEWLPAPFLENVGAIGHGEPAVGWHPGWFLAHTVFADSTARIARDANYIPEDRVPAVIAVLVVAYTLVGAVCHSVDHQARNGLLLGAWLLPVTSLAEQLGEEGVEIIGFATALRVGEERDSHTRALHFDPCHGGADVVANCAVRKVGEVLAVGAVGNGFHEAAPEVDHRVRR